MNSFTFYNPTRVILGDGALAQLQNLIPLQTKTLLLFGSGSIKSNGIYDRVIAAVGDRIVLEVGGILPNPTCEQCDAIRQQMEDRAIELVLAVGGGSVIDAAKYIAVAAKLPVSASAWDLIENKRSITEALPVGVVLTLPASGSEMNGNAVISNLGKKSKRTLKGDRLYPLFAVLDPEVTKGLSQRQIANGIVDAFSHIIEQYLTFPSSCPVQDRFSEGLLATLIELGPLLVTGPYCSDRMASFMWAATCASNGFASIGAPSDWSTHMIAHELTVEYGLSHAESIGVVLPGVIEYMERDKRDKLVQYGRRVFALAGADNEEISWQAVKRTEAFFASLGQPLRLSDFGLGLDAVECISRKIGMYPVKLGERKNIGEEQVRELLLSRV
ncbi:MAG: iron-containing alcohol dehydrogenase [Candidatus Hydrogenedentales bacterium]|jgi:NADP-dependent alcohol dehydrogenase